MLKLFCVVLCTLFASASCKVVSKTKLIVFGDSVSDIGNTYRTTFNAWPTKENYPKGTFSNKQTWSIYLTQKLRSRPGKDLHNYALGSATTDFNVREGKTGPTSQWPVAGVRQQIEIFDQLYDNKIETCKDVVAIVSIGVNDVYFGYVDGEINNQTTQQWSKHLAGNVTSVTEQLAKSLNETFSCNVHLMVTNMYPGELTPWGKTYVEPDQPGLLSSVTDSFNQALKDKIETLQMKYSNSMNISMIDLTSFMQKVIAGDITTREIITDTPCLPDCDAPDSYVYYDLFHPTEWVHRALSNFIYDIIY